ncbi:hypothetical protein BOTBODRAFT_150422 [Botryobasidium botryosum FD-172 SS1]|uniref:rRNA adenine N(6)-methyltransferase n=1 Tax=Botryobasidium botryosum (strain FD-172 SS1) TaxID=930990 RepID=A0A067NCL5_BOTB1|nr:hypothetical protein BOTBODRAFT_150422 [Botryobasidium botryosum FD-172 SS1]
MFRVRSRLRLPTAALAHRPQYAIPRAFYATNSPTSTLPPLPPLSEWRKHFPLTKHIHSKDRISLYNANTAAKIVSAMGLDSGEPKTIIEAYPGPGVLTRALLELPPKYVKKIIVLEAIECYHKALTDLAKADDRVTVIKRTGYDWSSYDHIYEAGLLDDVPTVPWSNELHPNLRFVSHLPLSGHGEQLLSQFIHAIPERSWLFRYGRMPMHILVAEWMLERLSAEPGTTNRCKLSVFAQAVADIDPTIPAEETSPYSDNFFPVPSAIMEKKRDASQSLRSRVPGHPFLALSIIPKADSHIQKENLQEYDFILRNLFIQKSTALGKALPALASGAGILVSKIAGPDVPADKQVDIKLPIRKLSVDHFARVVDAFKEWPFAPKDLLLPTPPARANRNLGA